MSAPSPYYVTQTPQREFAVQRYCFFPIYTKKSLDLSDFSFYVVILSIKRFILLDLRVDLNDFLTKETCPH